MSNPSTPTEESPLEFPPLNQEVDIGTSTSSSSQDDVQMEEPESTDPSSAPKKTRKRKRKLCEECGEKEAAERKKQRNFKWTDKNRPAFEKCQKTRVLKQAVETAKKNLGHLLVEQITATEDASKLALGHKVEEAKKALYQAEQSLAEFKQAVPSPLTSLVSE